MQYKVEKTTDGSIQLIEDIPEPDPNDYKYQEAYEADLRSYNGRDVYPTIDQDKPYWESKLGMVIGEGEFVAVTTYNVNEYAVQVVAAPIPPKEADEDLWEEAEKEIRRFAFDGTTTCLRLIEYLRTNFTLNRKS